MTRTGLGALGLSLVVVLFAAPETSARQPCRPFIEHLEVAVEEVRIDGVLAAKQPSGSFAVDGGVPVETISGVVFLEDSLQPGCAIVSSPTFTTFVVDPFTGELVDVTFEVAP